MAGQVFRIDVVIDPRGVRLGGKVVSGRLKDIENKSKSANKQLKLMRGAFLGIGIGLVARQFIALSDAMTNARNRLRNVIDTTSELVTVERELFRISKETRTSFEATAIIYSRVAANQENLGRTTKELLQFTESLNQAIILSGASAQEARSGLIQFSQGLASNRLSGDELRSVLEQLPAVADVVAKSLKVTRGELRDLGKQGKLTADVVLTAFEEAREELEDRFGKTVPSISQAFTVLTTNTIEMVAAFNDSTGASTGLATVLIDLAEGARLAALGFKQAELNFKDFAGIQRDFQGVISGGKEVLRTYQAQLDSLLVVIRRQGFADEEQLQHGRDLTKSIADLTAAQAKNEKQQRGLTDEQKKQNKELAFQDALLAKLSKPLDDRIKQLDALAALLARTGLTGGQRSVLQDAFDKLTENKAAEDPLKAQQEALDGISDRLEDARKGLELFQQLDFTAGAKKGLQELANEAERLGDIGNEVVHLFADRATQAIVEFARTGELEFGKFASALLDDIAQILIRLLVVKAISSSFGLSGQGGGLLSSLASGALGESTPLNLGRAHGGTVQGGQAPFPVGERGQELFVPNRTGTIVPAASAAQPPPQVNITLVTVQNEDMVAEAIASGSADEALIQRTGANKDRMRAAQG